MADLIIDGFDKYGPAGVAGSAAFPLPGLTAALQAYWTLQTVYSFSNAWADIVTGLNGVSGQALRLNCTGDGAISIQKTLAANYSRLIGGVRIASDLAGSSSQPAGVAFIDGTTTQCVIGVNPSTGTISLYQGYNPNNGLTPTALTAIATSSTTITAGTSHFIEWDITFAASGAYQVWLDGVSIFSGTGVTRQSANSYANVFLLGTLRNGNTQGGQAFSVDDLYLFDSTGTSENAVLLSNPRVDTKFGSSQVQTAFAIPAGILGRGYQGNYNINAPGANQLFLTKVTPDVACIINSVSCVPGATNGAAKFKAVIYQDVSNTPAGGLLLSSGTEVVGATNGVTLTSNLSVSQALGAGISYWIGFITDTSVQLQETDVSTNGVKAANTYASGAPSTCPAITAGQPDWQMWGNITGMNTGWPSIDSNPALGDLSYIADASPGDEDLYTFPPLISDTTVAQVYTTKVSARCKISGSGSRTISLQTKSTGIEGSGSGGTMTVGSSSYTYFQSFFPTDPATSLAWTSSRLNAASSGVKIVS